MTPPKKSPGTRKPHKKSAHTGNGDASPAQKYKKKRTKNKNPDAHSDGLDKNSDKKKKNARKEHVKVSEKTAKNNKISKSAKGASKKKSLKGKPAFKDVKRNNGRNEEREKRNRNSAPGDSSGPLIQKNEDVKQSGDGAGAPDATVPALREVLEVSAHPLEEAILELLEDSHSRALNADGIAKKLGISKKDRAEFHELLKQMELDGKIARIRQDHYVKPEEADLFPGVIMVHTNGFAHVLSEQEGVPDLYIAAENIGVAMHGDRVLARMDRRSKAGRRTRGADRLEGRVIRILKRAHETIVGTLQKTRRFFYVVPDDPRFQNNVYVEVPEHPINGKVCQPGDKVVVRLIEWASRHVNPEGEIIENLGSSELPGVDILSIIRKYHLETEFPKEVLKEAEQIPEEVDPEEAKLRSDWRDLQVFTIDPDDARDFDDAIYVEDLPGGGWRLGVHIADVSHYVTVGSALDKEALSRGNSVYFPDRVVPMLPERLSNGICSLNPNVDRLTKCVILEFNKSGVFQRAEFEHAVIRSQARLTYKEAYEILQNKPTNALEKQIHKAWKLAALLRKRRFDNGSLGLDFPEIKVVLDESGKPIGLEKIENDISHQLIEEFMLAANEAVARTMLDRSLPTIYRIHEKPDSAKLAEFREFVLTYDIKIGNLENRREVQKLLAMVKTHPDGGAIRLGLLKSLKKARYAPACLGHYGLAKSYYCHFTSPIRRYADLVVHRGFYQLCAPGTQHRFNSKLSSASLSFTADHISATERTAIDAEREAVKLKQLEYFVIQSQSENRRRFQATITDVRNFGMFVELQEIPLSGLIHISSLTGDFYRFDPGQRQISGVKHHKVYKVGTVVTVEAIRVDLFKRAIDFKIAE